MAIDTGDEIWISCEVKPGPFSNERMVLIQGIDDPPWFGFVNESMLDDPIREGKTFIRAIIIEITEDWFKAQLPGNSMVGRTFRCPTAGVTSGSPISQRDSVISG